MFDLQICIREQIIAISMWGRHRFMQEQEAGFLLGLLILVYDVRADQEEVFFIVHSFLTNKGFVRHIFAKLRFKS